MRSSRVCSDRHAPIKVLVLGAGPAGCAAAVVLARAGCAVTLADQRASPREKVCGDALIPDALAALDRLGLLPRVLAQARALPGIRVFAPDGCHVDLGAALACLQRSRLDHILRSAAVAAGAREFAPARLARLVERDGIVRGALLEDLRAGAQVRVDAELTLLATGASAAALETAGMCRRRQPGAVALRTYFRGARLEREVDRLWLSYDRSICPGYGWIFPLPEGVFNVGVGCFTAASPAGNLRRMFETLLAAWPQARRVLAGAEQLEALAGAPLRTGLRGACHARPGLMVIGEAAGSTYACSGEGIGKALETGMLAARVALEVGTDDPALAAREYERRVAEAFAARFAAYDSAQRWLARPALCNFIARRARRGRFVARELEGLLAETTDPRRLFSPLGMARALFS